LLLPFELDIFPLLLFLTDFLATFSFFFDTYTPFNQKYSTIIFYKFI